MAENEEKELTLKGLVVIFATALVSSGSTLGVKQYIDPPTDAVNRQVLEAVKNLGVVVSKLSTDAKARPDSYTGTMAKADFERVYERLAKIYDVDEQADQRIQGLRDRVIEVEGRVRALDVSQSQLEYKQGKLNEVVIEHNRRGEGGFERIKQLESRAHTHGN